MTHRANRADIVCLLDTLTHCNTVLVTVGYFFCKKLFTANSMVPLWKEVVGEFLKMIFKCMLGEATALLNMNNQIRDEKTSFYDPAALEG